MSSSVPRFVGLLLVTLVPHASAQEEPSSWSAPKVRVTVTDGTPNQGVAEPDVRGGRDGGAPGVRIAEFDSDELPGPVSERVVGGPDGDRETRARSGDPFFLGFVAGEHRPPAGERLDPRLGDAIAALGTDARDASEVYAFIMMGKRITDARVASLEALGVRHLGYHPYACLKAAIPVAALPDVANHPDVRWVGVARPWQKVHPHLISVFEERGFDQPVGAYINLFESDLNEASTRTEIPGSRAVERNPDGTTRQGPPESAAHRWQSRGWQELALRDAGVDILEYVDGIRAFRVELTYDVMMRIVELDFVQFVEAEIVIRTLHDESTPMILADRVRTWYDGGTNGVALVGQIDSGVRASHEMLNHAWYVGWDDTGSTGGVWADTCDHGSHVMGSMLGLPPSSKVGDTGVAPGLGWGANGRVRVAKWLEFVGSPINDCTGLVPINIPLSHMNGDYNDGNGNITKKAHVVNNSWGSDPGQIPWVGSEYLMRTIDDEVYGTDIMYVFAAGNAGSGAGTIGAPAAAKNAFAVGNVVDFVSGGQDPGTISTSSSRGPCGDGRWKPNVSAPGNTIWSALGTGDTAYGNKTGTSMAAPHVTGVVAQLVDRHSFLRYEPARLASLLMATATTRNNQLLESENDSHLDTYGTGRVDAYRAVYETSEMEWTNWGFNQNPGTWNFGDFTVGSGATRLVVCMHYNESSISAGASKALLNDFDLYIDRPPVDTSNGNTGEYTLQKSTADNTEIRYIDNPDSGTWRWKTFPQFTLTPVHMSVTVHVIYGDTTPDGSLTVSADDIYVKPFENVTITATVDNPDFVASAVFLDSTSSTPASTNLISSSTTLNDGLVTDLTNNPAGGWDVLLGNIRHGTSRTQTWVLDWSNSGSKTFEVNARSDNWVDKTANINVIVDGAIPGTVANLQSTSHTPNVWSSSGAIHYSWSPANDGLSGIDGYGVFTSTSSTAEPGDVKDIEEVTSYSETLATSSSGYYFKIKAVDHAGNWGNHVQTGPYLIDAQDPGLVADLLCITHNLGQWSNDPNVSYKWNPATDSHSGLDGYGVFTSTSATSGPGNIQDIGAVTTYGEVLSSNASGQYFKIRSVDVAGNWDADFASVGPILIDVDDPGLVSSLTSTTHAPGVWSTQTQVGYKWGAAADAHSGLDGYGIFTSASPTSAPGNVKDLGPVTTHSETLAATATGHYFKIKSVDVAGNWDDQFEVLGPILVDDVAPTPPSGFSSPTHDGVTWSNDPSITVTWSPATDAHSGLDGYATVFTNVPATTPSAPLDTSASATSITTVVSTTATWYLHIRADDVAGNGSDVAHFGPLLVDLTAPKAATGLISTSHDVGVADVDPEITMKWTAALDVHSGLAGYIGLWDQSSATVPAGAVNIASGVTSHVETVSGAGSWYFHLRSVDAAGNLGPTVHAGPYKIVSCVQAANVTYGSGKPGTLGVPVLNALDTPVLGSTSTVRLENALPGALPILFLGVTQQNIPFDGGALLTEGTWILALPFPVLPDGTLPLVGPIPDDAALCGFKLFHQVMFADPGAAGYYGLAQTAGLVRTFGY